MSKTEKRLIPELRFPEFEKDGEWEKEVLGHILIFQTGYPFDSKGFNENMNGVRLIKNRDLKSDDKLVFYSKSFDEKYIVNDGDVLVGMDGDFTPHIWKRGKALLNQRVGRIIATKKGQEVFFYYFLNIHLKRIEERTARTTVKHLSHSVVEKIYEALPKPKEQQKIASCLSSLDDVIAGHTDKLENLKQYKKGLLQNVFPQDGETVPKLRFKEFEKDGEWNRKLLDDVCKLVRGPFGGALKKEIFVKEGYAVYEQSHAIYSDFSNFRYQIDNEKFNELKRFSVKSGDLIMSCSGTMGKFAIIPEENKSGVINQALLKLTVKKSFDNVFIKMTLETENNQEKLLSQSAGGAIKNVVSVSQIRELPLLMPSFKEQQKIAFLLSSLDDLIQAETDKIAQLKIHKKGLLQRLFPKID